MPDRILVVPPDADILRDDPRVPAQLIEDLERVASLPDERVDAMVAAIEAFPGFLSPKQLKQVVAELVKDGEAVSSIVRILHNLDSDVIGNFLDALQQWRARRPENEKCLSDATFQGLRQRLPRLIRSFPALDRYRKARRLATIIGHVADDVEIICDLRPVFSASRKRIEGMIPFTILKLSYEDANDDRKNVELVLPEAALDDLASKAKTAQEKLRVLRESVSRWIPDGLADMI